MNLQPLYDVKDRLESAAIAGTGLLPEDFRLKRAAENLKPLAAASPVFGKIDAGLAKLLSASPEVRAGLLLDVLSLVDAVAYTQARPGADGELEPLRPGSGQYRELSWGQLSPLLTALTSTGGGRMETIKSAWENHPEFFSDFRVLPAVVAGLGDSYGEIADLNAKILEQIGPAAVPLLKEGFDPAGKKEMARRTQVLEEIAGASENPWYLAQLPNAKKPVRQALVLSLRHDPANAQKLIELCRTEKKECLDAARFALARTETDESRPYWEELAQKDPAVAAEALRLSSTRTAAVLTAGWFLRTVERLRAASLTDGDYGLLGRLRAALEYKTGPEICQAFRAAAALGTALDRDYSYEENGRTKTGPMRFYCRGATNDPESQREFSAAMPFTLLRSIQLTGDPELLALAGELGRECGGLWLAPALCATLLTQDSQTAGQQAKELLRPKFKLFGRKDLDTRTILRDALWGLSWWKGSYAYTVYDDDPANAAKAFFSQEARVEPVPDLDPVWFELLMETGGLDEVIMNLARPMEGPAGERLGKYLCHRAMGCRDSQLFARYTQALLVLGWTGWKDYWLKWVRTMGEADYYTTRTVLDPLPISGKEKAAQLREVTDLIWTKKLRAKHGRWPDALVKQLIAQWENE